MLNLIIFVLQTTAAFAVVPKWYNDGPCGGSMYPDAGQLPLMYRSLNIVGGQQARKYEFPYQVLLKGKRDGSVSCGGAIINTRWIITASHCFDNYANYPLEVVIGEHTIGDPFSFTRRILDIEKVVTHPGYFRGSNKIVNDIALIKVKQYIGFNSFIQPVCGPDSDNNYADFPSVVSGWGRLRSDLPASKTLRYANLNLTSNEHCQAAVGKLGYEVTPDTICTTDSIGNYVRDTCQGDSGGPVVVRIRGKFTIVGLVSWGYGCAEGYPGLNHRVTHSHEWILETISKP